jgi:hypothetical protein
VTAFETVTVAVPSQPFHVVLVELRQLPNENFMAVMAGDAGAASVETSAGLSELTAAGVNDGAVGL